MMRKISLIAVALTLLFTFTGCVDRDQLKKEVLQALDNQQNINNYRFSGSASLNVEAPASEAMNPLASSLMTLLANSEITWEGVSSIEPVQAEALFRIKPQGGENVYEVPLLIKDNKMYIHIPVLSQPDHYFEIDLAALNAVSGSTNENGLQGAGTLFAQTAEAIAESISAKQFDEGTEQSGGDMRVITASFEQKQAKEAISAWFAAMPLIVTHLSEGGYLSEAQAEQALSRYNEQHKEAWQERSEDVTLHTPATVSFHIDQEGFIRVISMEADVSTEQDGQTRRYAADVTYKLDLINQNPPLSTELPANITPLTDILKLMAGQSEQ